MRPAGFRASAREAPADDLQHRVEDFVFDVTDRADFKNSWSDASPASGTRPDPRSQRFAKCFVVDWDSDDPQLQANLEKVLDNVNQ